MASTSTTGVSANAPGVMTGKPLIESDRVEGTAVYDPQGKSHRFDQAADD